MKAKQDVWEKKKIRSNKTILTTIEFSFRYDFIFAQFMLSLKQKTNKHKNNTTLSSCKKKKRKKKNICKQMPVHVILLWLSSLDIIMPFQEAKENLFGIKQETTLFFRLFKLPTTLSMLHLSWNQDNDKIYVWVNDFSDKQTKKCEASQWKWVNDILSDKKKTQKRKTNTLGLTGQSAAGGDFWEC